MFEDHCRMVSVESVARIGKLPQGQKRLVGMIGENFDMFSGGRHIRNWNSSMVRLHHKIIIG